MSCRYKASAPALKEGHDEGRDEDIPGCRYKASAPALKDIHYFANTKQARYVADTKPLHRH